MWTVPSLCSWILSWSFQNFHEHRDRTVHTLDGTQYRHIQAEESRPTSKRNIQTIPHLECTSRGSCICGCKVTTWLVEKRLKLLIVFDWMLRVLIVTYESRSGRDWACHRPSAWPISCVTIPNRILTSITIKFNFKILNLQTRNQTQSTRSASHPLGRRSKSSRFLEKYRKNKI